MKKLNILFLAFLVNAFVFAAKVEVRVKSSADSSTIVADLLKAAGQAMPNSNPLAAEVILDQNGKVVKVLVNLPDNDATGLENARSAIENSSGIATAVSFPVTILDSNLNGLVQSDVSSFTFVDQGFNHLMSSGTTQPGSVCGDADAADSVGGSGSAIECKDTVAFTGAGGEIYFIAPRLTTGLPQLPYSRSEKFSVSASFKLTGGAVGDTTFLLRMRIGNNAAPASGTRVSCLFAHSSSSNWLLGDCIDGPLLASDTGVLITAFVTATGKHNGNGDFIYTAGSVTQTISQGFVGSSTRTNEQTFDVEAYTNHNSVAFTPHKLIIDDVKYVAEGN